MTQYEIWIIVISAISAVATFSAVGVALWLGIKQWKKRMYLTFNNNLTMVVDNERKHFLELTAFNGGNTKLAISNIYLTKKKEFALPIYREAQLFQKPEILDIGESLDMYIDFKDFIFCLNCEIKRNKINQDKNLKLVVEEITGKIFTVNIGNTPKEYILWDKGEITLFKTLESEEDYKPH